MSAGERRLSTDGAGKLSSVDVRIPPEDRPRLRRPVAGRRGPGRPGSTPSAAGRPRARGRSTSAGFIQALVSIVAGLLLWQAYVKVQHVSSLFVVSPLVVLRTFGDDVANGVLGQALAITMKQFVIGFTIGCSCGIGIGLMMGTSDKFKAYVEPTFVLLYVTPAVALAPILIVLLGFGLSAHVAIIALSVVFPVAWNTCDAARAVESDFKEVGLAYRASWPESFFRIALPGSASGIFTGVRLGLAAGLHGAVLADFFGSTGGIGFLIFNSATSFNTANLYVGVVVVTGLGLVFTVGLRAVQKRVMRWDEELR